MTRILKADELSVVVYHSAQNFATLVECELRGIAFDVGVTPRPELFWDGMLLALHLLDRWTLSRLGFAGRELAMNGLFAIVEERGKDDADIVDHLRESFNRDVTEYGGYARLVPDKDGVYKGTLCWEVAKKMSGKLFPDDPLRVFTFFLFVSQTASILYESCDACAEAG